MKVKHPSHVTCLLGASPSVSQEVGQLCFIFVSCQPFGPSHIELEDTAVCQMWEYSKTVSGNMYTKPKDRHH